jgi:MraZ protein
MFRGTTALTLDVKGRLAIPTKHRDALTMQDGSGESCGLVLTVNPVDNHLLLYQLPVFNEMQKHLMSLPNHEDIRQLQLMIVGMAEDVEMDSAGRILVSSVLRDEVGLDKDVVFVGQGNRFQVWSKNAYDEAKRAIKSNQQNISNRLAEVGFSL